MVHDVKMLWSSKVIREKFTCNFYMLDLCLCIPDDDIDCDPWLVYVLLFYCFVVVAGHNGVYNCGKRAWFLHFSTPSCGFHDLSWFICHCSHYFCLHCQGQGHAKSWHYRGRTIFFIVSCAEVLFYMVQSLASWKYSERSNLDSVQHNMLQHYN